MLSATMTGFRGARNLPKWHLNNHREQLALNMPEKNANGAPPSASKIARRVAGIEPFRVVQILERARELERGGRHVVHLEVGEPDFPTAPTIVAAGVAAMSAGRTGYTQALGLPVLRAAIAERYGVAANRVAVTTGASGALNLLAQILIDPGDEVLVSDPGYPCNDVFVQAAGGAVRRVPVSASTGYQMDADLLRGAWTARTAGVLLGSPSNPTGSVLDSRALGAIRDFVAGRAFVIVDEIYQGLVYDHGADLLTESALTVDDGFFVVNSFSKYFGMTGWRLGWLVAPEAAMDAIERVAQNLYIAPPTVSQYAALAALQAPAMAVHEERRRIFARRRDVLLSGLESLGLPAVQRPAGAFYAYVDISDTGLDSETFCARLIEDYGVAVTPGTDFGENGAESHVRFAYTVDERQIEVGIRRIGALLRTLTGG